MAASVLPPQQHSQPSRKGKKAWRKNVDITQLESGLDTARSEVIQTGAIIAELDSSALFHTDSNGDVAIRQRYLRGAKPLRSDEILAQRSAVPSLDSRKRKSDSRTTNGVLPAKKRRQGCISRKQLERLREIAYRGDAARKDVVDSSHVPMEDLWAQPEETSLPATGGAAQDTAMDRFSFLERKKPVRAPATLMQPPVSLLASGLALPAIPKPEPGRSYNPSFESWDAVIQAEGAAEVAKERQRLRDLADEAQRDARVAKSAAEATRAEEEADESAWESEWEGFISERDDDASEPAGLVAAKKRPRRKTPAERNKIARRKAEERRRKHDDKTCQKMKPFHFPREVASTPRGADEPAVREDDAASDADDDAPDLAATALRRRRFGKFSVSDAPLDVVLADELQDSLRALRPEGNLLLDRFRSMQVRGMLETRRAITQPKKARMKATEKWSYKDWKLKY